MKRAALIIGSPDKSIPGVYDDMKNYRVFFKSFAGGAWLENEIVTLESPSKYQVQAQLEGMRFSDYSVVVFAGHGEYSARNQATMLHLNSNTLVEEHDLKIGAPRRTLIIDACRVLARDQVIERMMKAAIAMDSYEDPQASRLLFEKSVAACHPGLAVLYSCSIGQGAGDIPGSGGRYSSALLQSGSEWASAGSTARGSALSVSDVQELIVPIVIKRSGGSQIPTSDIPRNVPRFPFAVKA